MSSDPILWLVIILLAIASLLTGLICSLPTKWGLFRHYWVLFTLVLNVFAALVLLMYTNTVEHVAGMAAQPNIRIAELRSPSFVLHSAGAVIVLLVALVLPVYKPRGLTPYGRRKQRHLTSPATPASS